MALELNLAVERLLYSGDMQEKRGERKEKREELTLMHGSIQKHNNYYNYGLQ